MPGAYDVPGVVPKMGCRNCYLYIGVDESWCTKDVIFEYHIHDKIRLKNGMEASITEVLTENKFVVDVDYSEGIKSESIDYEDIEHILRRYE